MAIRIFKTTSSTTSQKKEHQREHQNEGQLLQFTLTT